MNCTPEYLRRDQAAEYLRTRYGFTTAKTLSKLASVGGGPKFSKAGTAGRVVLYRIADLDAWAEAKIGPSVSSTASSNHWLRSPCALVRRSTC